MFELSFFGVAVLVPRKDPPLVRPTDLPNGPDSTGRRFWPRAFG